MDSLISRQAAIEAVKIPDDGCVNSSERHGIIFARVEARRAIQSIPSVPAIPIDKLCEWLTEIDMPLADACPWIGKYYHECTQCDFFQRPIKECWKEILSKLMEEQSETD